MIRTRIGIRTRSTLWHLALLPVFAVLALGSGSKKGEDDKSTAAATAEAPGKVVTVGDATWTILDTVDRGSPMKATDGYSKAATTTGRFIQVHLKVANVGKKEGMLGNSPKLVDENGREFGTMDGQYSYLPKDAETIGLDKVQPSMSKDFYALYEIPAGIGKLSLQVPDFGIFGDKKSLALGNIPAAAPASAPPPTTAAAPAAKGATKAAAAAPVTAPPATTPAPANAPPGAPTTVAVAPPKTPTPAASGSAKAKK